jgi:uncharacterized protein YndB with AHSA1/START domain
VIDLTRSLTIDAPAPAVWAVLSDYARDPEWRTGVLVMEPSPAGPVAVGTTTHEEMRLGGRAYVNDGVVDEVDPGRRLAWHTTDGADASGSRLVEALPDGGCRATLVLRVRPHGAEALMAPIVRRLLDRGLRRDLEALAALVEARTPVAVRR